VSNAIGTGAAALQNAFGQGQQSWENRIREAAYTSPSGIRITFDFEDVSRETTKRTADFDFPNVDGAYVQDNGFGSRRYPLRCIFSGKTHDLEATAFEAALLERGVGKLEHPFYGPPFNVVPFGDITRRDDLVSGANQTIVEVTFWTTVGAIYPTGAAEPKDEIQTALDGFNVAAAQQLANSTNLIGALNKANAKASIRKFLGDVSSALQSVSSTVASVRRQVAEAQATIQEGLDVFVGQPLLLAQQISDLIQSPGRALAGIESQLDAYGALEQKIFGESKADPAGELIAGTVLALRIQQIANDFHLSQHFAMAAVSGSVLAVTGATFTTKPEALSAAETVQAQFDSLVAVRDAGFVALQGIDTVAGYQIDTGDAMQALSRAVALTVGFLVEISFTLVPERRVVLDRARTIVDLAAELYASVDDKLDFLIATNNLTGDQILELQPGTSIVYYP
jgi:prophage DNA circulation protein